MKRIFIFITGLLFICQAQAANVVNATNDQETQERILEELVEIRAIQDSTYQQRIRALENINSSEKSPSEYSFLYDIKGNTEKDDIRDGWNFYGWTTLVISIVSLIIATITFFAQKKTERHTKNAPISVQKGKLEDLPRHFYRNLVCSSAIISRFLDPANGKSGSRSRYPSESNLLKLCTLPDDIFLPIEINERSYKEMHELKLLFRNYNVEVQVASEHLSRKNVSDDSLTQDFDNILFKPFFLIRKSFNLQKIISPKESSLTQVAATTIIEEHFDKLKEADNIGILLIPRNNNILKQLLGTDYIKGTIDKKGAIMRAMRNKKAESDFTKVIISRSNHLAEGYITTFSEDKEKFIRGFNSNYKGNITDPRATLSPEDLYDSLKPYLDYISRDKWNFETLLFYVLAVDTAIECDRIGMINY